MKNFIKIIFKQFVFLWVLQDKEKNIPLHKHSSPVDVAGQRWSSLPPSTGQI